MTAVVTALFAFAGSAARADVGPYLDSADWSSIDAQTEMGPEGVPQVRYRWGVEDNPVTVASWALQHWSWWTEMQDPGDQQALMTAADWFVSHQRPDGAWEYAFDFNGAGVQMTAPWISAMAQGQAISVLVRAYSVMPDQRYLDAAALALAPFDETIADGGVVADWGGLPWYEEYPTTDAQHVLNGFEFALVGLHDLADRSARAQQLFDDGIAALAARIGSFDVPTAHSQYYAALGRGRVVVTGGYPRYHAVLTRELATLSGDATLAASATKWEGYLAWRPPQPPPPPSPAPPQTVIPTPAPKPTCRFRGIPVRTRGGVSCLAARRALRQYVRSGRSPRRWRCHTARRVICRSGAYRVSAPRYARSRSSAQRAHV